MLTRAIKHAKPTITKHERVLQRNKFEKFRTLGLLPVYKQASASPSGDGSLPERYAAIVDKADATASKIYPPLSERLDRRDAIHTNLNELLAKSVSLALSTAPSEINRVVFAALYTISEAHLPQRAETWCDLKFGIPPPTMKGESKF